RRGGTSGMRNCGGFDTVPPTRAGRRAVRARARGARVGLCALAARRAAEPRAGLCGAVRHRRPPARRRAPAHRRHLAVHWLPDVRAPRRARRRDGRPPAVRHDTPRPGGGDRGRRHVQRSARPPGPHPTGPARSGHPGHDGGIRAALLQRRAERPARRTRRASRRRRAALDRGRRQRFSGARAAGRLPAGGAMSGAVWQAADAAPVASSSPLVRFWAVWDRFWFAPRPLLSLALLRVVTFGTLLMYIAQEYVWVMRLQDVDASFYRPILAFELFGVGPIPSGLAAALRAILVVGGVLGLLGIRARMAAAVCAVAYLYSVGQVYSFTNVHHGDSLLGIALVALALCPSTGALSVFSLWRRGARPELVPSAPVPGWPVQLVRVQIAVTYF